MNGEQLHYFELAYRERNYSAAARLVPCSPQGLAKAVHNLERELGVVLFDTDPETGLPVPTDYARELYEYVCVNESNLRLLRESFQRLRGEERYVIKVGFSLGVMGTLGPEFLKGFRHLHPNVTVNYWETDDRMCERGLRDGSFDLSMLVEPYAPGLATRVLYRAPSTSGCLPTTRWRQRSRCRRPTWRGATSRFPARGSAVCTVCARRWSARVSAWETCTR